MSKPRDPWWPYIKNVLRAYPAMKRELDAKKAAVIIAKYDRSGGGSGEPGRTTEGIALRELDPARQREFDAVQKAIRKTGYLPDGRHRNDIIRLMYFRKTHNLYGAAEQVHVSYATAKNWHSQFVRLVAKYLDLE